VPGGCEGLLAERRAQRPRPHLDNKILTSWNALAIAGLAEAASALRETEPEKADAYLFMAQKAVEFVKEHLSVGEGEELYRSAYVDGKGEVVKIRARIMAFADDYAFLINALLAVYQVNFDEALLQWAEDLQRIMDLLFWDTDSNGGYFLARADDPSIFARQQEDQDGAEPCTNSVAACNLLRLHALFGGRKYRSSAENIFRGASDRLERYPLILPKMVVALDAHVNKFPEVVVVGKGRDSGSEVDRMLRMVQAKALPFKLLVFIDMAVGDRWLVEKNPRYMGYSDVFEKEGKPTVYICRGSTCQLPVHTPDELQRALDELV